MKRIVYFFVLFIFSKLIGQTVAPGKINYQGVARDLNGTAITAAIDLQFIITDNGSNTVHTETQSNIQPNAFGIFSTQIGLTTALSPAINWQAGPYTLAVSMKPSSAATFTFVGSQQLASVPFALYAERAGNSMPTATVNGSTLRWDQSLSVWKTDTNILNNGSRVNIGSRFSLQNNKLAVIATNASDSAAIFGFHKGATNGMAGVRGFASGNSLATTTLNTIGIIGGHFLSFNLSGQGIGSLNQGYSTASNGIGAIAIGSSSGVGAGNNFAVGLYATTDPTCTAQNKFAGVFDKGNVFIRDTLQLDVPGNIGDVLTRTTSGKAIWQTPGSTGSPWVNPTTTVTALQNSGDFVGIGTSAPLNKLSIEGLTALTGFPYSGSPSTKISIQNSGLTNLNYQSLAFATKSSQSGGIYSSGEIVSENIDHGITPKGNLIFLTRETGNIFERMRIDWDGKIGINTSTPGAQLDVKNSTNGVAVYANTNAAGSATSPAIFGEAAGTSTNNAGVYGLSSVSSGVKGFSQNLNGVWGESVNNTGVFGLSTGGGQAGKFLLQSTSSANNAVYIATNSTPPALKAEAFNVGAAIEAKHSNATAGSSNAALLINDGHLKSVGAVTTLSNTSTIGGFSSLTSTCTNCTDVKGAVSLTVSASTVSNGDNIIIQINFTKNYLQNPVINITPISDFGRITYYVSATSQNFFQVKLINSTGTSITPPTTYKFNYFVIE